MLVVILLDLPDPPDFPNRPYSRFSVLLCADKYIFLSSVSKLVELVNPLSNSQIYPKICLVYRYLLNY